MFKNPTPPQHSKRQNPCIKPCPPQGHMAHTPQNPCSEGCEQLKSQVKAMSPSGSHAIYNNTSSIEQDNNYININNNINNPDYRQERRNAPEPPQAAKPNGKNENNENIKNFSFSNVEQQIYCLSTFKYNLRAFNILK